MACPPGSPTLVTVVAAGVISRRSLGGIRRFRASDSATVASITSRVERPAPAETADRLAGAAERN